MSSHREAPAIALDPVADSTDLYAFVSPDEPTTVTIIANYLPAQLPSGGPNFFEFGQDVLYEIHISNADKAKSDITYQFQFETVVGDPNTFLYNTGPISSLSSPNWNRKQFVTVTRVDTKGTHTLGKHLACPPCNVGSHSCPSYSGLSAAAVHTLKSGEKVFCGQRSDAFYVDIGSIFDLGDLRPFQGAFVFGGSSGPGVNSLAGLNVHSIAIQVPITQLTSNGKAPTGVDDKHATIGVWTTASRRKARIIGGKETGPWVQVSRLGNPLINEVIIPMGHKDYWNGSAPSGDSQFVKYYAHPELAGLLPVLYPGVFPNLAGLNSAKTKRADLEAVLLTGIPSGVVAGFQNYTGSTQADMLRLNMAVPPASSPSVMGLLGGDAAGFPNGRRVFDDVTTIELRAVAGLTYALVDPSYHPDGAASAIYDVADPSTLTPANLGTTMDVVIQSSFPYLGDPRDGFDDPASTGVLVG